MNPRILRLPSGAYVRVDQVLFADWRSDEDENGEVVEQLHVYFADRATAILVVEDSWALDDYLKANALQLRAPKENSSASRN